LASSRSGAVSAYRSQRNCPIVTDCKHAAAVLIVARHLAAAARLVERQRRVRTSVLARFARRLHRERRLAGGVGEQRALALLLVVTSFETYLELRRHAGLAERQVVRTLHGWARTSLLAG